MTNPPCIDLYQRRLGIVHFILGLPLSFLGFMLPVYGDALGGSPIQIGLLYTAFSAMTIVARPLVGAMSDRIGRRPFLLAGLATYAGSLALLAAARGLGAALVARALQGVASSLFWLVSSASVADVASPDDRARRFGAVTSAEVKGEMLGSFLGFAVLFASMGLVAGATETLGLRIAFAVFAAALLGATAYAAFRLPETMPRNHDGPVPGMAGEARGARERFVVDGRWAGLLAASFSSACAGSLIAPLVILMLRRRFGAHVSVIALAYVPMGIVWAVAPPRVAGSVARKGPVLVIAASLGAAALAAIALPFMPTLWAIAILWAVVALFDVAGNMAEKTRVAELCPRAHGGKGYGLYVLVNDVGAALGPLIGTSLLSVSERAPFYAAAALFGATSAFVLATRPRR